MKQITIVSTFRILFSGGSKGGCEGRAPPPLAQNFFIFMQFLGKIGQIIGWAPPLGLAPPPLGNPGSATALSLKTIQFWKPDGEEIFITSDICRIPNEEIYQLLPTNSCWFRRASKDCTLFSRQECFKTALSLH